MTLADNIKTPKEGIFDVSQVSEDIVAFCEGYTNVVGSPLRFFPYEWKVIPQEDYDIIALAPDPALLATNNIELFSLCFESRFAYLEAISCYNLGFVYMPACFLKKGTSEKYTGQKIRNSKGFIELKTLGLTLPGSEVPIVFDLTSYTYSAVQFTYPGE